MAGYASIGSGSRAMSCCKKHASSLLFQRFPCVCLSRACLGKTIVFSIKWAHTKKAFSYLEPHGAVRAELADRGLARRQQARGGAREDRPCIGEQRAAVGWTRSSSNKSGQSEAWCVGNSTAEERRTQTADRQAGRQADRQAAGSRQQTGRRMDIAHLCGRREHRTQPKRLYPSSRYRRSAR